MNQILDKAYQGLVNKASPTGLLPIWDKWVDKKVVKQYGFSYNVAKAKKILADAGYKDTNGDGYVENKDGSPIDLKIICPNGWSDWMTSIQVIADSAKAVGIKITPAFPEYGTLVDDRGHAQLRPAARQRPAVLEHALDVLPVHLPAADPGRTRRRSTTSATRTRPPGTSRSSWTRRRPRTQAAYQASMTKLQTIFLQDLPAIPLWYNGMWSMVNTQYWTNWPSSDGRTVHAHLLAELLADDGHRHAHAPPPREHVEHGARSGDRPTPLPVRTGRGVALSAVRSAHVDGRSRVIRYLARKLLIYLVTFCRRGDDRLGDPAAHARRPDRAAALAHAGAAVVDRRR